MTLLDDLLGMRTLLVSSHSENKVMSYQVGSGWTSIPSEAVRGVAVGQDSIGVAGRFGIQLYDALTGKATVTIIPNDDATHEVAFLGDGSLVCCSPKRSSLTKYTMTGGKDIWTVPGVDPNTNDGRSWINGVSTVNGEIAYVTALGLSNVADGWRGEAASERGALIDARTNEILLHNLFFPHTPIPQADGSVLFLNSGHGQVCSWKPGDLNFTEIANLGAWTRGLAMLDSTHALVGVSQGRLTAFPNLTTDVNAQPGLSVVDLTKGFQVEFLPLDVREIFDVVLSDVRLS